MEGRNGMKVYRGPRTTNGWKRTDEKDPKQFLKQYLEGRPILFDATIEKYGQRHTDIGVLIEDEDVAALVEGFRRRQKDRVERLEKKVAILERALLMFLDLARTRKSLDSLRKGVDDTVDRMHTKLRRLD